MAGHFPAHVRARDNKAPAHCQHARRTRAVLCQAAEWELKENEAASQIVDSRLPPAARLFSSQRVWRAATHARTAFESRPPHATPKSSARRDRRSRLLLR